MSKRVKELFKNIGFFSIAQLVTRAISFLLLPLYTAYLSTAEYGTIDLVTTLIQLLLPVFTLSIADAVLRFGISENERADQILKIGIRQINIGILPVMLICIGYMIFTKDIILCAFLIFLYIEEGHISLYANFSKATGRTRQMTMISILVSAITIGINVIMIAILKLGLKGYFYALLIGDGAGIILYYYMCDLKNYTGEMNTAFSPELKKKMLSYSIPLIPNSLFWWINSCLDRWALMLISGVPVVGIYSVAYKIPSIIAVVNGIFMQAWNISLFQNKEEGRKEYFKKVYNHYIEVSFCSTIIIITLSKIIARFGFSGDFFDAWKLIPLLAVAVFFNSTNAFLGSMFTSNNDNKKIFSTTLVGAVINCLLNYPLIILWGSYGAAAATTISCFVVYIIRVIVITRRYGVPFSVAEMMIKVLVLIALTALTMLDSIWIAVFSITGIYCLFYIMKIVHIKGNKSPKTN